MLQVKDLKKLYKTKGGEKFQALDGVTLDFPNKGFVFIIGKSGSGKSTLLNVLGGLDKYDSGEIIIKGKSSKSFKAADFDSYRNTYLGFVFQEFNLLEEITLAQNVALALELQSYKGDVNKKVEEILTKVELLDKKNNKINELSGGQKQRVAIARALVKDPEIIIADEPTGNLDSETSKLIMQTLSRLSKEKLVIMVTHDVDYAAEFADRVIEMKDGVVLSDETRTQRSLEKIEYADGSSESVQKIIRVPKSKRVDNNVLDQINELIAAQPNKDLYITFSFDKNTVAKIEPKALELSENAKSSVEQINLDYTKDNNFKLIKSKLPTRYTFGMAMGNVWRRKVRLFFTVLLMTAAIFLFGQSEAIRQVDFGTTAVSTIQANDLKFAEFNLYECEPHSSGGKSCGSALESNLEGVAKLEQQYQNVKFGLSYSNVESVLGTVDICRNMVSSFNFYTNCSNTKVMVGKYSDIIGNAPFLHGRNIENENSEIIISDFYAASIINDTTRFTQVSQLIGHELFSGKTIVGIYETNYLQHKDSFMAVYNKYLDTNGNFNSEALHKNHDDFSLIYGWTQSRSKYGLIIVEKLELGSNGFISGRLNSTLNLTVNGTTVPSTYINVLAKVSGDVSSRANFHTDGQKVLTGNQILLDYNHYLNACNLVQPVLSCYGNSQDFSVDMGTTTYTVVGYYQGKYYTDAVLADVEYVAYNTRPIETHSYSGDRYVIYFSGDLKNVVKTLNLLFDGTDTMMVRFEGYEIYSVFNVISTFKEMKKVFFYTSMVMLTFATFLLFNTITGSVLRKKKEIGTLRAIGARGGDVSKIFLFEGLIISIMVACLSLGAVYYVSGLMSRDMARGLGIHNLINVKPLVIAEIFGVAILASIIASFLPVKKVSSMRPIDAIRNK